MWCGEEGLSLRANRVAAYLLLFIQLFLPASAALSGVARAAEQDTLSTGSDMMSTMDGISALMNDNAVTSGKSSGASGALRAQDVPAHPEHPKTDRRHDGLHSPRDLPAGQFFLPSPPPVHDSTVRADDIFSALPTLDMPDIKADSGARENGNGKNTPSDRTPGQTPDGASLSSSDPGGDPASVPETLLARGMQQAGQILQGGNALDASVNYARSLGENLLNQQVNDWLNQFGKARVRIGSDKTVDGDILLPLTDRPDSLLFTQAGLRKQDGRNVTNLGLGYRQSEDGWMWGVNGFYDYDITGGNSRAGAGGELWTDYLKLGVNGYFRLTDWHQSPLREMRDYDERPADGFDIRAEGYLPDYPQLGAFAKYEQYFGDNIYPGSGASVSGLKSNPARSTFGLSYTPVPLVTVKGQTARGDAADNQLSLEFNYRFGVPLKAQLDPDNVDIMRSLAGNRYDFVDRNYNIVMQYRKQALIALRLTADKNPGFAGETVTVTAAADSKYGLERVEWLAPALLAAGGHLTPAGGRGESVRVNIPAAALSARTRSGAAAPDVHYLIEAVAYDREGNEARSTLDLSVTRSPRDISVRVTGDKAVADGHAVNTVEVTAKDTDSGQPLAGEDVVLVFTYTDGPRKGEVLATQTVKTDEQGRVTARVSSSVAAGVNAGVRLKSNGNGMSVDMLFVDSAGVVPGVPEVSGAEGEVVADGRSEIRLVFPVTDDAGNPLPGQEVIITTTNGAKPERVAVITDEQGNAAVAVTSTVAGVTTVTAEIAGGKAQSKDVTFVPGAPDASRSEFTISPDVLAPGGIAGSEVNLKLVLRDVMGNQINLSGNNISFDVSGPEGTALSDVACGAVFCTARLRSALPGDVILVPVFRGVKQDRVTGKVTFKTDVNSVKNVVLTAVNGIAPSDDKTQGLVQVLVTDASGDPVPGVPVEFHVGAPAHFISRDYATDSRGIATASLVSPSASEAGVTATVNSITSNNGVVRFVADAGMASFEGEENVVLSAPVTAGNTTAVTFTAKDAGGQPVSGQPVTVTYSVPDSSGTVKKTETLLSDENGRVIVNVGSTKAGPMSVVAEANSHRQTVTVTVEADSAHPVRVGDGTTLRADPDTLWAGGNMTLTLELKDRYGNAITGRNDIESGGTRLTETGTPGTYAVSLIAGAVPGTQTVSVSAGGTELGKIDLTVEESEATLTVITNNSVADGAKEDTLELSLTDTTQVQQVNFSVRPAAGTSGVVTVSPATGNTVSGHLSTSVTSNKAGEFIVTAELPGGRTISKTVTFIADEATAGFGSGPAGVDAVAGHPETVSFVVKDANDNPIKNLAVQVTADNGATPSSTTATTDADGVVSLTIINDNAGPTMVTATVNGKTQTTTVNFAADGEHLAGVGGQGGTTLDIPDELVAGNPVTVTLDLKDEKGNAVTGLDDITLSDGTRFTETAPGKYQASLQADNTSGQNQDVSVQVGGKTLEGSEKSVPVKADAPAVDKSALIINPGYILADGTTLATVTLTLKDGLDNFVTGKADDVRLTSSDSAAGKKVVFSGVTESMPGVYTATLSGTVPGEVEVTASIDGQMFRETVRLMADERTARVNGVEVSKNNSPADNTTANELTATVVDGNGNAVANVTVNWSVTSGGGVLTEGTSVTDDEGKAVMTLKDTTAETVKVLAHVGANAEDSGMDAETTFTLYPVVKVTPVTNGSPADGKTANTVQVSVTDIKGNPLDKQTVTITATPSSTTTVNNTVTTDTEGKASLDVTSTVMGSVELTAAVGGGAGKGQAASASLNFGQYVKFDGVVLDHTAPTTDATAAGKICQADCDITLSAKVVDAAGNAVPGVSVSFLGSVTGNDGSVVTSGADGMVTVTRKYDKGGVEDVSLVALSQGVTIGTSTANKIDILPTITRSGVHATPTGPMLRASLSFMGPKTPVNSYPTDLDPEVAKAGSYRCTATAKYVWQHGSDGPFTAVVEANGKTNSKGECEMVDDPQDAIENRFRSGFVYGNPANYALYWPVTACYTSAEYALLCTTYVWGSGSSAVATATSDRPRNIPTNISFRQSQSALPDGVGLTANTFQEAVTSRSYSYWLGYPGALKVTVTPGVVDAAGVAVNGPLFTDVP